MTAKEAREKINTIFLIEKGWIDPLESIVKLKNYKGD